MKVINIKNKLTKAEKAVLKMVQRNANRIMDSIIRKHY